MPGRLRTASRPSSTCDRRGAVRPASSGAATLGHFLAPARARVRRVGAATRARATGAPRSSTRRYGGIAGADRSCRRAAPIRAVTFGSDAVGRRPPLRQSYCAGRPEARFGTPAKRLEIAVAPRTGAVRDSPHTSRVGALPRRRPRVPPRSVRPSGVARTGRRAVAFGRDPTGERRVQCAAIRARDAWGRGGPMGLDNVAVQWPRTGRFYDPVAPAEFVDFGELADTPDIVRARPPRWPDTSPRPAPCGRPPTPSWSTCSSASTVCSTPPRRPPRTRTR